ncbi:MAG: DUF6617 family protein [Saprospiraceae bacterium]
MNTNTCYVEIPLKVKVEFEFPSELKFAEKFPLCCPRHAGYYKHLKEVHKSDDERALSILEGLVLYVWFLQNNLNKPNGLQLCRDFLHIFGWFPEITCIYQKIIRICTEKTDSKEEKIEVDDVKLSELVNHIFQEIKRIKDTNNSLLKRFEIFKMWCKCLPFDLDNEAIKYMQENCNVRVGEGIQNHFFHGETLRLYTDSQWIKNLSLWSATMLNYFSHKLKEDHPKVAFLKLKRRELEYKHKLTYQRITKAIGHSEELQIEVLQWIKDEKDFYADWRILEEDQRKPQLSNSFGFKGQPEYLTNLYNQLYKFDLIKCETSKDDFINTLSKNWDDTKSKILWNCETVQIRYIIDQMQPMFDGLTVSNIERSKKHLTKQNKALTASNLSNASSRMKMMDIKDKDLIQSFFKQQAEN